MFSFFMIQIYLDVVRKGNFTRSGLDSVDEIEMFRGDENPLVMKHVYTQIDAVPSDPSIDPPQINIEGEAQP